MARKIVDGKAVVSAKELEASGLSLRDFLNKEQGLTRKAPEGTKLDVNKPRNPDAKAGSEVQHAGTRHVTPPHTPTPSPAKAQSLVDQGRGVQLYKDVDKEAVLGAGLGLASLYPGTIAARTAYGVARPAIGAAARYFSKKDSPASVADDIKDPSFNPEKMVDRSRPEHTFNPDKMVDRRSTTFPGRTEQKFNPEKMTGRDQPEAAFNLERMAGRERPEPMKKGGAIKKMASGGKVSSASSRGDGIAQRGKTKGRMC